MITKISIPVNATSNSTSCVINRKETSTTASTASIKLKSRKTRRGGDNLLSIPAKRYPKTLNGCFQESCVWTACQSTSCLYRRELTCASDLNCVQSSWTSMPAVSLRQPSFDFQTTRRKRVFKRAPKTRIFPQDESIVDRTAVEDVVFTSQHTVRTQSAWIP